MKPKEISSFKSAKSRELMQLYNLLQRKLRCPSYHIETIKEASQFLKEDSENITSSSEWGYDISDLILPIATDKHILPTGLRSPKLKIECSFRSDISKWGKLHDPFLSYSFAAIVFGEREDKRFSICWHIDKDFAENSDEHHPLYHLQYSDGLNHFANVDPNYKFDWGDAIYLDTPRISHYPLDIVLAIGFCLTNFQKKGIFESFLDDPFFCKLYKSSQEAILKPYFLSMASHWDRDDSQLQWKSSSLLCPQLC